jgi:microcystin synthetase protein McyA
VRAQLDYWLNQPWEAVRPLPLDFPENREANSEASARAVAMTLSVEETQALLTEVPRAYHTQINEVLLTALVQAFTRWTGIPSLLVHLEGHGREDLFDDVDLSRTVGWFTVLAPLVLSLENSSGEGEALQSVKEQLRQVPQGGLSFGLLRYLSQEAAIREQLAALPQPQVSFNYAGRSATEAKEEEVFVRAAESVGVVASPRGQRPHMLEINGGIVEGQLNLEWTYSEHLHRRFTIEGLAQGYLEALQALIRHCQSPQAGGYTPSDFPLARLDEQKLRELSILLNKSDKF